MKRNAARKNLALKMTFCAKATTFIAREFNPPDTALNGLHPESYFLALKCLLFGPTPKHAAAFNVTAKSRVTPHSGAAAWKVFSALGTN
jgi:hypothetical protein